MNKKLLLISYNFSPEPTGIGKYNGEMIAWFVDHGYDCTVITSYPYYPYWKVQEPYFSKRFGYTVERSQSADSEGKLTVIRCPQYVPRKPSGLKRVLLEISFFLSAALPLIGLLFRKKFNYVVTISPSFQNGLLGVFYKSLKKAKLVYHIQDLQIEAARDLNLIKSEGVISILFKIEKFIFDRADIVSSISEGMVSKIKEKAKKPVFLFPNWTDVTLFFPIEDRSSIKQEYGFNSNDKIILYSGSIGEKQGLEAILHAANELRHIRNLKFIICGSGPYKQALQTMSENLTLDNLQFLPLQPFEKFNQFLNLADLHLIIQKASASDLVMPSKLTTILSTGGLTLITANKGSGLHSLINDYNIGLFVDAENQQALNEGIVKAMAKDLSQVSRNARKYAENFLSIDKIMPNFEQILSSGRPNKFQAVVARTTGEKNEVAVSEEIPFRLDGERTEG